MPDKLMKCYICGADTAVGESCSKCGWNEEEERLKAIGAKRRLKLMEEAEKPPKKKSIFGGE